ncbi:MAG: hypothetical protein KJZ87_23490, partial [Thermoguttaceae bacterium]|nr:hypothetical protein [Thermoguttaceae bacterium]
MIMQPAGQLPLVFFDSVPVVVESSAARISSDAGRLPFCQLDEHLRLTRQFTARGDAHPRPLTRSASEAKTNPKRKRAQ